MQELNEKFEIEYVTETVYQCYSVPKKRAITQDLWMIDYIFDGGYIGFSRIKGEDHIQIIPKVKPIPIGEQIKELMLKAKYETGGDKYCEMKKEFEHMSKK